MIRCGHIALIISLLILPALNANAQSKKRSLYIDNADKLDLIQTDSGMVTYGFGNVRLQIDSGWIYADTAILYNDQATIQFFGNVEAFDSAQRITAGRASYYDRDLLMIAEKDVVMVQTKDSIRTESQYAEFDRRDDVLTLRGEPVMYLNWPNYPQLVKITAKELTFYSDVRQGMARDSVRIKHQNTIARSQCAEFYKDEQMLVLLGDPVATKDSSTITGDIMQLSFAGSNIERIDVFDNARAHFIEDADTASGELAGSSDLNGRDIFFFFENDEIRKIAAIGAAESSYLPAEEDTTGNGKNFVSGDSIFVYVEHRRIMKAEIKGGAEGVYITKSKEAPPDSSAQSDSSLVVTDTTQAPDDSTALAQADAAPAGDTLAGDSVALAEKGAPEDSIHYKGNFLEYFAPERIIRVTGNSEVRQQQVLLNAERVDYDIQKHVVYAEAKVDSSGDSVQVTPLSLRDEGDDIYGTRLVFNTDTKKGKIEDATTQMEQAYYSGRDLFKENEQVFYVENGQLTTCEDPNYYFWARRMKIIYNERAIARPVVLYIFDIPVMYAPYYVFPLKRGRHSGILPIRLGNFEKGNRFIGNLGYYWAASEYWDIETALDFFENTGFTVKTNFRYNKRYAYSGNVDVNVARDREEFVSTVSTRNRWSLAGTHRQKLPYDIDFGADVRFISDNSYYTDYSIDPADRLNRNIISKANFSKSFGWSSLSWSFSHTDNLDQNSRSTNLPDGRFTVSGFNPFGSGKSVGGKTVKSWYNTIYFGYSNSFQVHTDRSERDTLIIVDTLTTDTLKVRPLSEYAYIDHSANISAPQNLFGYATLTPSVSLQETWYYINATDLASRAGIPGNRPYRRGAFSAGVNSNTDIYGTFPLNLFGLLAFRHVVSPSVGFSWSPAIVKNNAVRSYVGRGGGGPAQKTMNFTLGQLFQAKVKSGDEERKLDLFRMSSSLSYNFEAAERKFSNLSTTISSRVTQNLNVNGNIVHNLYDQENKLKFWSPYLQSFSINTTFQARGSVADDYSRTGLDIASDTLGNFPERNTVAPVGNQGGGKGSSWNVGISHSYYESRLYGDIISRSHQVHLTGSIELTGHFQVKYSQGYDFVTHEVITRQVEIYRRMHCWEGRFTWIPDGSRQGFYFKLNVIAIPDIKFEKSESGIRGALLNR